MWLYLYHGGELKQIWIKKSQESYYGRYQINKKYNQIN